MFFHIVVGEGGDSAVDAIRLMNNVLQSKSTTAK